VRSRDEQERWSIILPVKNSRVDKRIFQERTGVPLESVYREKIARLKEHGLLEEDDTKLQATRLGAFYADELAQQFHSPDYIPFAREEYADGVLNPYRP
jgi:oxygen-independent coproporphyrinogen-3 oxidase